MFRFRLIAFLVSILLVLAVRPERRHETAQAQHTSSRAPFSLELPDIGGPPITAVEAHIPTTELRSMKLAIRQPFADAIDYGKIYTAINGEAANTICGNIRARRDGKVITCDLESKPRFHLQPGKNVVEISATDRDNKSYYASYVLIAGREPLTAVASSSKSQPVLTRFSGRKFAAIIGVSRYQFQDAGLNDLQYADADARAVRDFLLQPNGGGFKKSDISYMENSGATTDAVRDALTQLLPRAGPNDLVFIYIASHGSPDPFEPQKLYFLMNDTKVASMPKTGLGMFELQEVLDQVRAQRVVVFIDACHSAGVAGTKIVTGRQLERVENNVFNLYASKLYREAGRAVLTSSDVNEISEEGPNWGGGHGVFTWALLEGLRGAADDNSDQVITAGEVFNYVSSRVRRETSSRQNPRALSGTNKDFPLALINK